MTQDVFLDSLGDGVFEIRLKRPERMNGRAFCAGADLNERKGMALDARMAHNTAGAQGAEIHWGGLESPLRPDRYRPTNLRRRRNHISKGKTA